MLYTTLFATLGDKAVFLRKVLLGTAIFFALIELVAFYIGGAAVSQHDTGCGGTL